MMKSRLRPIPRLLGGDSIPEAARICVNVLSTNATAAQIDVVIANAALAIHCFTPNKSLPECAGEARIALESGKALNILKAITQ